MDAHFSVRVPSRLVGGRRLERVQRGLKKLRELIVEPRTVIAKSVHKEGGCAVGAAADGALEVGFDALTFTYLLRYEADPQAALIELARVVKPGGRIASLEFAVPDVRGWRWSWWLYTRLILPVAGYATGGRAWWDVGRFLGPSISSHYKKYSLAWTLDAWRNAGIEHVEYRTMSLGGGVVIWGYRTT